LRGTSPRRGATVRSLRRRVAVHEKRFPEIGFALCFSNLEISDFGFAVVADDFHAAKINKLRSPALIL
jgi:hypothetical protein